MDRGAACPPGTTLAAQGRSGRQQCRAGPESPPSDAPGQAAQAVGDTPPHGGSRAGPGIPSSVLSARREARTLDTGEGT